MLTVTKIKNLKPELKPVTYKDSDGLFLMVTLSGSKFWKLRYSFNGK